MHISSPSSRKSATRPAFSRLWLRVSAGAEHAHVAPELLAQTADEVDRLEQPLLGALHAAVLPHDLAELLVEGVDAALAVDLQEPGGAALDRGAGLDDGGVVGRERRERALGEVVADRVGQDEVAVGQALHQRRRAEPVGAVVGEVGLAGDEQPGDRRLQVVVDPQPAHDVVHGGVDPHRHLVRVLAR